MGVTFDFSDITKGIKQTREEVQQKLNEIGIRAVQYAKDNISDIDKSGKLGECYDYQATDEELVVENTADYASLLEAKGVDILSSTYLKVMKEVEE